MKPHISDRKERLSLVVTAGPTREKIDPIRFISNYSTGKFGYEIAREARRRGHRVLLISGPTNLEPPKGVRIVIVESALEMREAVKRAIKKADCLVMNAAVCDWRAHSASRRKIKRRTGKRVLELIENPDILKEIGRKKGDMILVGFALETEDLGSNAYKKLREKNLDIILANRHRAKSGVFGDKRVDVLMVDRHGKRTILPHKSKAELAKIVLDNVSNIKI